MQLNKNSILEVSRRFFFGLVLPVLQSEFPAINSQSACGFFGYGSECLGMDDGYSQDHHFGLRVNMLLPEPLIGQTDPLLKNLSEKLPRSFEGISLRIGHVQGIGVAPESLEGFLTRTIGITHKPKTWADWLKIPEEDITHVINGQVWHDPTQRFSTIRSTLKKYYPDAVWKRRMAHWCRYFSGMGLYALKRAVLRKNWAYATTAFGRTIKWAMELAFLLNRTYFPYDKWLHPFFEKLPLLAPEMKPLLDEAVSNQSDWKKRIEIFERVSDLLDQQMVELKIVPPHPTFLGSVTSGYRLLEHNYAAIMQSLPTEIVPLVPLWDQVYLESFHSQYVSQLPLKDWDRILNLTVNQSNYTKPSES